MDTKEESIAAMNVLPQVTQPDAVIYQQLPQQKTSWTTYVGLVMLGALFVVSCITLAVVMQPAVPPAVPADSHAGHDHPAPPASAEAQSVFYPVHHEHGSFLDADKNECHEKKPLHASPGDEYFKNTECLVAGVADVLEQAAANVTKGYKGTMDAGGRVPITEPYWKVGLCPVNVHWHKGAEHLSMGEYDDNGSGPAPKSRKLLAGSDVRLGHQCHFYDAKDPKFTTEYEWKHCVDTHVGETYEVHWPHSAAGACGTPSQYQSPFYDGVFCRDGIISLSPLNTFQKIGVQGQVFTIVNDEKYYYPDLIKGMIVDGDMGSDMAFYTGSTTGTSRDNNMCSRYTPITWQVDRKCHLISASTFDKMCADMKAQRDDMSMDLHPHGSREVTAHHLTADNHMDGGHAQLAGSGR